MVKLKVSRVLRSCAICTKVFEILDCIDNKCCSKECGIALAASSRKGQHWRWLKKNEAGYDDRHERNLHNETIFCHGFEEDGLVTYDEGCIL